MRILIVCRSMPWHVTGGLENHAWDLARGLSAGGDEVHVLTTQARDQVPLTLTDGRISIHEVSAPMPGRYSSGTFYRLASKAVDLDRRYGYDVIHAQGFAANAFGAKLASKLIITVHGTITSETELYPTLFSLLSRKEKINTIWQHRNRLASTPLFRRALHIAQILLVDSLFTRNELIDHWPALEHKIRVIPLGIHPERVPGYAMPHEPHFPMRLLSVGRVTQMKGFHVALEALARLRGKPWTYTIVGIGPELDNLKKQSQAAHLGDQVRFAGALTEPELHMLRQESDLFVFPELSYPAFGLVALEALLSNLPVVASDRGAIPEVVQPDSGWLVPGNDADALAERIDYLIQHPEEVHAIAVNCASLARQRFSFQTMIEHIRKALGELSHHG
jgi:glycosyltransferase involved in cell wall biosynthesis